MRLKHQAPSAATRQALLEAAGAVFAEHGYRNTTVRRICQRAGANVAAVNYHFGDKEHLYIEVIRHAHGLAAAKYPFDLGLKPGASPEARLAAFVRSFLLRIFDPGPTAWMGRLIAMEMINPGVGLAPLVWERIQPMAAWLGEIVAGVLGPGAEPERVRLCGFSIVSQCVFYAHCRSVVTTLYPDLKFDRAQVERLADHITRFSLAGLKCQAGPSKTGSRARRRSKPARAVAAD